MSDDYLLPGMFLDLHDADAVALHLGGLDSPAISRDDPDVFGNDPYLEPESAKERSREQLPQFGPPFVQYVHEQFDRTNKLIERLLSKWAYEPVTVVFPATMQTDGTGAINRSITANSLVYEPPPGFTLALHRFSVKPFGISFGAPYNAAGSFWELRVNDEFIDGGSTVAPAAGVTGGILPVVKTWGTRDAPRIRDGEVLSLFMSGGPANTLITCKGQGTLERQAES